MIPPPNIGAELYERADGRGRAIQKSNVKSAQNCKSSAVWVQSQQIARLFHKRQLVCTSKMDGWVDAKLQNSQNFPKFMRLSLLFIILQEINLLSSTLHKIAKALLSGFVHMNFDDTRRNVTTQKEESNKTKEIKWETLLWLSDCSQISY